MLAADPVAASKRADGDSRTEGERRGRAAVVAEKQRQFTAVGRVLLPVGQRAAALPVELVVEEGEGGEVLGADAGPAQVEHGQGDHNNSPVAGGGHDGLLL